MNISVIFINVILFCVVSFASAAEQQDGRCSNSNQCDGTLVCRDTGGGKRCVGRGEQDDFCSTEKRDAASKTCGGTLICRDIGNGGHHCVGRGQQDDLCAKEDAGSGSKSCGGDLKCRNTGNSTWNCIGRGQEGDLCSEEEAGKGSWNCAGFLVCGRSGSNYICKGSNKWMSKIADKTPIAQLTIPGTHDSATFNYKGAVPFVVTQESNLREQLDAGIRFLDIRARVINDVLAIHHERFFLDMFFGDVLDVCKKFLEENPTETIFMSVKKDWEDQDSKLDFKKAFLTRYYNDDAYKSLWYDGTTSTTFPTMGDVRKKIVLMSRDGLDEKLGIDFHIGNNKSDCRDITKHEDTCDANGDLKLYYEDLYEPNKDGDKVDAISSNLKKAQSYLKNKNDALWVTFTSANKPQSLKGPEYYAKSGGIPVVAPWLNINGKLMSDMHLENGPMGIVSMDFPSGTLILFLIETNNAWTH